MHFQKARLKFYFSVTRDLTVTGAVLNKEAGLLKWKHLDYLGLLDYKGNCELQTYQPSMGFQLTLLMLSKHTPVAPDLCACEMAPSIQRKTLIIEIQHVNIIN